jgi:2-(1,2-epoxy-1,2-dihydrophenyl)acetyl-CoA isomerase
MMQTEDLSFNIVERVATLTLNRPDKLNALSEAMIAAAIERLELCATDSGVGAIVVTGTGRGFCTGGDVSTMKSQARQLSFEERVDRQRGMHRLCALLYEIPKVTIAAINGAVAGAGLGLALACDLRFATERAKFTTAFAKVGFSGDFGTTWKLTRLAGPPKAKELLFLSDVISASDAERLNLVNRVFPDKTFADEVRAIAQRIASGPLVSYRYMKENVNIATTADYRTMLDREALTHLRCGATEDHREGVAAFLEKRPPRFKGR